VTVEAVRSAILATAWLLVHIQIVSAPRTCTPN